MFPPPLASDLPAPRDDEPASLRRDIADELADHLQSAFTHELHRTPDESAARQHVLDRFGNPTAIARKLWFDAMQEKIMSQRMLFAALIAVVVASAASTGVTWFVVRQSGEASQAMLDEARAANEALLEQSRQANQALVEQNQKASAALLDRLGKLSTAPGASAEAGRTLEWNPVKVRLYTGEKPGQPAVGYEVEIMGHVLDTAKDVTLTHKTDAQGVADFGLMRPGRHHLMVRTPWGEFRGYTSFTVLPGEPHTEEVSCPPSDPGQGEIDFSIDWPADLKAEKLWTLIHAQRVPREFDGLEWAVEPDDADELALVTPEGEIVPLDRLASALAENRLDNSRSLSLSQWLVPGFGGQRPVAPGFYFGAGAPAFHPSGGPAPATQQPAAPERVAFLLYPDQAAVAHLTWGGVTYRVRDLIACKAPVADAESEMRKFLIVGGLMTSYSTSGWGADRMGPLPLATWTKLVLNSPDAREVELGRNRRAGRGRLQPTFDMEATEAQRRKDQPTFTVRPGEQNHWQIAPPPKLLELVRATVKAAEPKTDEPN